MSGSKLSNPAEKNTPVDAPLAMTVHELPTPTEVVLADERRAREQERDERAFEFLPHVRSCTSGFAGISGREIIVVFPTTPSPDIRWRW